MVLIFQLYQLYSFFMLSVQIYAQVRLDIEEKYKNQPKNIATKLF
jgi:hypothetical protein